MLTKQDISDLKEEFVLKAYYISVCDGWEEEGLIVFANSEAKAAKMANRIGIGDYDQADSVMRRPEYDKYAALGYVPNEVLYRDGWYFECDYCGERVNTDKEDEYRYEIEEWLRDGGEEEVRPREYAPQFAGKSIYCSPECRECREKEIAEYKLREGAFSKLIKANFPNIEIVDVYETAEKVFVARFKFPGGKHHALYRSDTPGAVSVSGDDLDAWEEYKSNR